MYCYNARPLYQITLFTLVTLTLAAPGASRAGTASSSGLRLANQIRGVWTAPPTPLRTGAMSGGAFLGNGDLGVVVGGKASDLQFYLGKSDFFGVLRGHVMPAGSLELVIPQLGHATHYRLAQNIGPATVTGRFAAGGNDLRLKAWVARNHNVLVLQLKNSSNHALHILAPLHDAWDTPSDNQASCNPPIASIHFLLCVYCQYITQSTVPKSQADFCARK